MVIDVKVWDCQAGKKAGARIHDTDPDCLRACTTHAIAFLKLGRTRDSIYTLECVRDASQKLPGVTEADDLTWRTALASAYIQSGNTSKGGQILDNLVDLFDHSAEVQNFHLVLAAQHERALAWAQMGSPKRAKYLLRGRLPL